MPDTDEQHYLNFRTWMLQPGALPERPDTPDGLHGMQALLEGALWAAWQAGYAEGARQGSVGAADD